MKRIRHASILVLFAALALLTGCAQRWQINVGADLATYVASAQWMFEHTPPGLPKNATFLGGYYDPEDGSITLNEQLHEWQLARVYVHELGHAFDHQRPADLWELMARYQSPGFGFNPHPDDEAEYTRAALQAMPDPYDTHRAIEAARAAAAAEGTP